MLVDDIIAKIITLTDHGKLSWELVGRNSFRAQIDNLFVSVTKAEDEFYTFKIYNEDGYDLESSSDYGSASSHGHLFELARRTALKVDQNLESLDRRLDELI